MAKLSVALATFNEEKNLESCLESVKNIADEIVIVDGSSTDRTVEIAQTFHARVHVTDNPTNFHINKQRALGMASNTWILQLDADERVSPELAKEIQQVISMNEEELEEYQRHMPHKELFLRHQKLIEGRDGKIGTDEGAYTAFFVPRLNYFLGRYLRYGGVYPDGVIRLVKKDYARFPAKDVHEQIAVKGRVGWLQHDLIHISDPTFVRYLKRNSRYVDLLAKQFREQHIKENPISLAKYCILLPIWWFFITFVRHKGFLDSWQGFVFSLFSALRFPRAYLRFIKEK
jgi:glycosyltransferase involved in cell wall biosynthesis